MMNNKNRLELEIKISRILDILEKNNSFAQKTAITLVGLCKRIDMVEKRIADLEKENNDSK